MAKVKVSGTYKPYWCIPTVEGMFALWWAEDNYVGSRYDVPSHGRWQEGRYGIALI
jgi:hypothetical protein